MHKSPIIAALIALAAISAPAATQADLDQALDAARVAWGSSASQVTIRFAPLNNCRPINGKLEKMAWTEFSTRTITLNSNCRWDRIPGYLEQIVKHELGHLETGAEHSQDEHSIMFAYVSLDQAIQDADRTRQAIASK